MKKIWLLLTSIIFSITLMAQTSSVALTPTLMSPSTFTLTTTTAGGIPSTPLTNYTGQSLRYTWPLFGDGIAGNLSVASSTIPSGITVTIQSANPGGWGGSSTGLVTIGPNSSTVISGIVWANRKTVVQTQNIYISDFSQLHPGNYVVTLNFTLQ